jgi:hypothetical protein|tara:strand:+ start:23384 stop:24310 length:927 start_codon:yes stop_codon:yes gene_type:complete
MKNILKINFVDFWFDFDKRNNYFYHLLSTDNKVVIDEEDPDLLFFSVDYGNVRERDKYKNHRCKKIFFTGESVSPNFDSDESLRIQNHQANYSIGKCDYAFTFDFLNDSRHYRLPLWVLHIDWFDKESYGNPQFLLKPELIDDNRFISAEKTKFCAMVFSNPTQERIDTYNLLSTYKSVDGFGKPFNNWTHGELDKYEKLKNYKFSVCYENRLYSGYYTEKLFHAKTAGTLPIYYCDKKVSHDFNEKCFINLNDYSSLDELFEVIKKIDQDDNLFNSYIREPLFKEKKIKQEFLPKSVLNFINNTVLK